NSINTSCLSNCPNTYFTLIVTDACGNQVSQTIPCCGNKKSTQQDEDSDFTQEIEIYPNPTTGIFTISNIKNAIITVFNSLMEEIVTKQNADNFTEIDLSAHSNGIYFVRIIVGEEVIIKKVEIMR
ncbi:MAG: T9SS type A sorting domain-containing protein, partial [Bacteroidales bacterium]|nr:T9SS type A sorting domain-containing protein [Bacteroidales bacterium]